MYGMAEVESIDREVRNALKEIGEEIERAESGQLSERVMFCWIDLNTRIEIMFLLFLF